MSTVIPNRVFESDGLAWIVEQSNYGLHRDFIAYALCPTKKCRVRITFNQGDREIICFNCHRKLAITKGYEQLREEVELKYQGSKRWDAQTINLDLVPTKITARDEDENYWIETKLAQKDGKRMAVVLIGEKRSDSGEKAQFFLDVEDELVRFDRKDKHPMTLLARVKVEFINSEHEITKKLNKRG